MNIIFNNTYGPSAAEVPMAGMFRDVFARLFIDDLVYGLPNGEARGDPRVVWAKDVIPRLTVALGLLKMNPERYNDHEKLFYNFSPFAALVRAVEMYLDTCRIHPDTFLTGIPSVVDRIQGMRPGKSK